eukprot:CAMPEP_0182427678 /NCGR_PEP_ID=MMETSP1167-20130531/18979_1 /TAXON_ID=2988 /ORGANISM="Mallomonas Sp, Strain CCMP3275" /LENGTH=40 /DNA_ID= /DNA_START= /DNA_END= /DNA_ORIENTATION=
MDNERRIRNQRELPRQGMENGGLCIKYEYNYRQWNMVEVL